MKNCSPIGKDLRTMQEVDAGSNEKSNRAVSVFEPVSMDNVTESLELHTWTIQMW